MAPSAIQQDTPAPNVSLKATARSFHPTGTPDPSKYHSASTDEATAAEAKYAAHNYHPLPIGASLTPLCLRQPNTMQSSREQVAAVCGTPRTSIISTSSPHTAL
jgi:hypothetical protein